MPFYYGQVLKLVLEKRKLILVHGIIILNNPQGDAKIVASDGFPLHYLLLLRPLLALA